MIPRLCLTAVAWLALATSSHAQLRLPAVFGDHMVLQQETVAPVWGWDEPGQRVCKFFECLSGDTEFTCPLNTTDAVSGAAAASAARLAQASWTRDSVVWSSTHLDDDACPPAPDHSLGYVWAVYSGYDIFSSNPDGRELVPLTDTPGYDAEATVCPVDGSIVFTSTRIGTWPPTR